MTIRKIDKAEKNLINSVVDIHLKTFSGFFLTFMGKGFLRQLYFSYSKHKDSGLLVAFEENDTPIGFLAYSENISDLYKFMIKKRLIPFAWYSLGAFFRKPKIFMRLVRAFLKPGESKRAEEYMELASIGVLPACKGYGVGSALIEELKRIAKDTSCKYIALETDAENNERANRFYIKNGFILNSTFETHEKRKMNEYRFYFEVKEQDVSV